MSHRREQSTPPQAIAQAVGGGSATAAADAISKASSCGCGDTQAIAKVSVICMNIHTSVYGYNLATISQALAAAISSGGGTAQAVAQAVAEAHGSAVSRVG